MMKTTKSSAQCQASMEVPRTEGATTIEMPHQHRVDCSYPVRYQGVRHAQQLWGGV